MRASDYWSIRAASDVIKHFEHTWPTFTHALECEFIWRAET